jgi:chitodextrinase
MKLTYFAQALAVIGFIFFTPISIAQPGWQQLPNTQLQSVCPANGFGLEVSDNKPYLFSGMCHNVFAAWSGGIADTTRNRLLIWGGGHVDYGGNELYSLNLSANPVTLTRLTDPSLPVYDGNAVSCTTTMPDGRPNIRHTTNSMTYLPSADRMFLFGGGVACGNGSHYDDTWTLDLSAIGSAGASGWQAMDPVATCTGCLNLYVNPSSGHAGDNWWSVVDYDPNTQTVFMFFDNALAQYNYKTNSYKKLASLSAATLVGAGGVIDPKRKLFFIIGNDDWRPGYSSLHHLRVIDISGNDPSYTFQDWTSQVTGCDALTTAMYPGLAYDSAIDRIVGWPSGGNDVYVFNPDTKSCTVQSYPNGPVGPPSGATTDGIFGRFRYFPAMDAFAVVPNTNQNAYLLHIASPSTSDTQAPSTPANLTAVAASATGVNLSWTASTDNVGVIGYYIFRGSANNTGMSDVGTSTGTSFADSGLASATSYTYTVAAYDAAGNVSNWSAAVTVTTSAGSSSVPPTVSLTAPAAGTSISGVATISATASSSVGIASVQFQLDGANLGSPDTVAPYSYSWNTQTVTNGSHMLTVVATDTSGNTATSAAVGIVVSNGTTTGTSAASVNGLGASTYTCLDQDGDGYGVGPGCTGPDADDTDATVHTAAQALAKYGSLSAFLTHLGYTPQHIWYLAPTTAAPAGNDATGVRDDVTHPYLTYAAINAKVAAGDMIMLRNAWNGRITPPNGAQGNPVVMMSYPGEQAVLDAKDAQNETILVLGISWWIVDGIKFQNGACMSGGTYDTNTASMFHDIFIRHVDAGQGGCGLGGFSAFNGLVNLTIEDSVFHDNDCPGGGCQHGVYLGSRGLPSSNVTFRRSIAFGNDYNGFTFNGRCTNCVFDQLLSYNNGIAGLTLEMGVSNSFARSNLLFNNAGGQLVIFNYPGDCPSQGGSSAICPYDQTGNLFENNTIYQTGNDKFAGGNTGSGCPAGIYDCQQLGIVVNNTTNPLAGNLGGNTFQNNIVVNYGYSNHYPPIVFEDNQGGAAMCGTACQSWLASSTFNGLLAYQLDGNNGAGVIGAGWGTSFGYKPYTCAQASSVTNMSNCLNGNPMFVAASPSYWNSIGAFNFQLQQSSPAFHSGATAGLPAYDIAGSVFAASPSMGAYEYAGAPIVSGTNPCDLNGDGIVNAADVQIAISQALGSTACGSSDLMHTGQCNVVDVQRVINASLGNSCRTGQ